MRWTIGALAALAIFAGTPAAAAGPPTPKVVLQTGHGSMADTGAWLDGRYVFTISAFAGELIVWDSRTGIVVDRLDIPPADGAGGQWGLSGVESLKFDRKTGKGVLTAVTTRLSEDDKSESSHAVYSLDLKVRTVVLTKASSEDDVKGPSADEIDGVDRPQGPVKVKRIASPEGSRLLEIGEEVSVVEKASAKRVVLKPDSAPIFDHVSLSPDGRYAAMVRTNPIYKDEERVRNSVSVDVWDSLTGDYAPRFASGDARFKEVSDLRVVWLNASHYALVEHEIGLDKLVMFVDVRSAEPSPVRLDCARGLLQLPSGAQLDAPHEVCGLHRLNAKTQGLEVYLPGQGWRAVVIPGLSKDIDLAAISHDGGLLAIIDEGKARRIVVWDLAASKVVRTMPLAGDDFSITLAFSGDDRQLIFSRKFRLEFWNVQDEGRGVSTPNYSSQAVAGDGRVVLAASDYADEIRVWDAATGKPRGWKLSLRRSTDVGFLAGRGIIWAAGSNGSIRFWSARDGRELMTAYFFAGQRHFVATPDGRYDTNLGADAPVMRWLMPDRPLQALAPQTFMRDYYEPRLAGRLLDCTAHQTCAAVFPPQRSLASLNRVLPTTRIGVPAAGPEPGTVTVPVEVAVGTEGANTSGAYDLRLFRDGKLVGQWPKPADQDQVLGDWRARSAVTLGADGRASYSFTVALPTTAKGGPVKFTAYAFNSDRVKSETAQAVYAAPATPKPRPRRAYVLAIGENRYDNPAWTLNYAAADARLMASRLSAIPGFDVESVPLVSDDRASQGTKAAIHDALILLTGSKGEAELREARARLAASGLAPASLDRLQTATPDDVVIITFAGHGWASAGGDFYLLPSDAALAKDGRSPDLSTLISSAELTAWMRDVDAGEMAIIIDACHSAASVEAAGFKAGPFGDAGLGQLAFDKGIRILAGAQADAVAMEDASLGQGLLTYALAREGLGDADARLDRALAPPSPVGKDGKISLDAWLTYAARRLPGLSQQVAVGRMSPPGAARGIAFDPPQSAAASPPGQEPSLFDFTGRASAVRLPAVKH